MVVVTVCFLAPYLSVNHRLNVKSYRQMGTIQTDRRHYEVLTLPPEIGARRRRSTDLVHALVTWTDLEEARDSARNVSRRERSAKEEDEEDDVLVVSSEEDEEEYARSKRSADGGSAQQAADPNLGEEDEEELNFCGEDEERTSGRCKL